MRPNRRAATDRLPISAACKDCATCEKKLVFYVFSSNLVDVLRCTFGELRATTGYYEVLPPILQKRTNKTTTKKWPFEIGRHKFHPESSGVRRVHHCPHDPNFCTVLRNRRNPPDNSRFMRASLTTTPRMKNELKVRQLRTFLGKISKEV